MTEAIATLRKSLRTIQNNVQIFLGKKFVNPNFIDLTHFFKTGNKTVGQTFNIRLALIGFEQLGWRNDHQSRLPPLRPGIETWAPHLG